MESLNGVVERITFFNEDNGYSVIKIKSQAFPELVTVVGKMGCVNIGSVLNLQGQWIFDSKYGKQFEAHIFTEAVPATTAGIEKYLGSGLIKGIGPVNAKRIVKRFRADTIRIIEEEPGRLHEVEGIGPKRIEMIKKAWEEQKEIKNVMLFLQDHGVSTGFAAKIYKQYGNSSIQVVRENPFRLADDIWGIGFKTADGIAQNLGCDPNSYERCRAGILYILNQLAGEGHCYLTSLQIRQTAVEMLEIKEETILETVGHMLEDQSVVREGEDTYYLPSLYFCETGAARKIRDIMAAVNRFGQIPIEKIIAEVEKENNLSYDKIQIEAIRTAAGSKFMILTGGPGTGKTTTTKAILKVFAKAGARILLAAPTGRAAKRLAEATGMEAKTIHRLLEYKPPQGYQRNTENPLTCDVLIIDEVSMVDIVLLYNLLKAVPDEAVVILVGDADQLPSVGPGNVLRDMLEAGCLTTVKLTRIFRQAGGSLIITNAHRINRGEFPVLKGERGSDFFFLPEEEPQKIAELIKTLCAKRLPKYYHVDPIYDIQVLTPMQRGEVGARHLNEILQESLNPSPSSILHNGQRYKLYDKVMQIKNNYDKNVFNGDVGKITQINLEEKTVFITFDQNEVQYEVGELDEVVLAYAVTIHKSQGSEYKIVVAPFVTQHYMMLQRNLLYTCVTRAKNIMVLVGSKKAVAMALRNNKVEQRNTLLAKRLQELFEKS